MNNDTQGGSPRPARDAGVDSSPATREQTAAMARKALARASSKAHEDRAKSAPDASATPNSVDDGEMFRSWAFK